MLAQDYKPNVEVVNLLLVCLYSQTFAKNGFVMILKFVLFGLQDKEIYHFCLRSLVCTPEDTELGKSVVMDVWRV